MSEIFNFLSFGKKEEERKKKTRYKSLKVLSKLIKTSGGGGGVSDQIFWEILRGGGGGTSTYLAVCININSSPNYRLKLRVLISCVGAIIHWNFEYLSWKVWFILLAVCWKGLTAITNTTTIKEWSAF